MSDRTRRRTGGRWSRARGLLATRGRFEVPAEASDATAPNRRPAAELSDRVHSQLLIDEELAAEVHRVGYVVAGQVLDHRALQAVREVHQRFEPLISSRRPDRWYTSGAVEDAEVRGAIYSELGDLVREAVTPLAPEGVRVLGSHFHVNPAGSSDGIAPHQDVPLVDEAIASTLNGWIPLTDVSDANAPLCVVPGSHRFGLVDRSLQMSWRYDGLDQLFREFAVPIPVPAGHLILFDGALVHCSGPNRSASDPRGGQLPLRAERRARVPRRPGGGRSGDGRRLHDPNRSLPPPRACLGGRDRCVTAPGSSHDPTRFDRPCEAARAVRVGCRAVRIG